MWRGLTPFISTPPIGAAKRNDFIIEAFILLQNFSSIQEAQEYSVVEAKTFESFGGTGIAVLIGSNRIFVINNVYDPKLWRASEIPSENFAY